MSLIEKQEWNKLMSDFDENAVDETIEEIRVKSFVEDEAISAPVDEKPFRYLFADDIDVGKFLNSIEGELRTVYDVGASTGAWSAYMTEAFPNATFHLFEPLTGHVQEYEYSDQYLKLLKNYEFHRIAVGDRNGELRMQMVTEANPYIATGLELGEDDKSTIAVPIVCLDSYVRENNLPIPDLLKVDVQGLEPEVLAGAEKLLPKIKFIMLECWMFRGYNGKTQVILDTMNKMREYGFEAIDMCGDIRQDDGRLVNVDIWFINKKYSEEIGFEM